MGKSKTSNCGALLLLQSLGHDHRKPGAEEIGQAEPYGTVT